MLRGLGIRPRVVAPQVEESAHRGESAAEMVLRLARAKAGSIAARLRAQGYAGLVLGADTAVVLDGRALGKPRDADDATRMLHSLSGRSHEVLTGVCLVRLDDARQAAGVERTRVCFKPYGQAEIEAYVGTGEPLDKAGAYAIQGAGAGLVAAVTGSWSNVVGLPLERLEGWFEEIGVTLAELIADS